MRILGVDPGYAILGYGIVDITGNKFTPVAYGSITTDASVDMPARLEKLFDGLTELIDQYKPDEASIEELFFNNNAKTAILVGEARGVAVLACSKGGLVINEYTPLQIKQALVGYGRADKTQVQYMVKPCSTSGSAKARRYGGRSRRSYMSRTLVGQERFSQKTDE